MCFNFCDEYLWVYFDLSVEILWVHVSLYYGGVVNINDSNMAFHKSIFHIAVSLFSAHPSNVPGHPCIALNTMRTLVG